MIPKFKVWDKQKEKIFDQSELIIRFDENGVGIVEDHYRADRLKDFELLHSTGLRDNNGAEIFEGDIVECYTEGLSTVEFEHGCFGLLCNGYFEGFVNVLGKIEIVGNIYEHPHLLEED